MDLQLYPLDRQMCPIIFQSSAHPSQELNYLLNNRKDLVFVQGLQFQEKMIPDFKIMGYKIDLTENVTDSMTGHHFTQFTIELYLERPLGFFLWEVYMPATFIVLMAFTSFWIDRKATPARVSLGVTTVLTMTTLSSSANANLPPTAYPKVTLSLKQEQRLFRFNFYLPGDWHLSDWLLSLHFHGFNGVLNWQLLRETTKNCESENRYVLQGVLPCIICSLSNHLLDCWFFDNGVFSRGYEIT